MGFTRRPKPAHYRGTYHVRSRSIVEAAYANPDTRCQRCRLRLHECRPHRNGKPARWQAGHVIDGQIDGELRPECSSCNATAGARLGNLRRRTRRTTLTW